MGSSLSGRRGLGAVGRTFAMADASPLFAPGTRLGDSGRYELRRRIGIGGMAEVYKAIDTRLGDRVVAIKTLAASVATHPCADKIRRLFIQEAQALSRVNDENVVDVLDFGVTDNKTPYMAMEFLQGEDLGVLLKKTQRMEIEDALDVMLGVCAGVQACHMAGIIHRDLKPANIFLAQTLKGRQAKVLDFSVAKVLVPENDRADKTRTDLIVGTPSYMSPEQADGQPANELSDQYSIGALLYRSLTGRPPRGLSPSPRELRPEIPSDLDTTILRAIDPTPANRFASVHELGQRLLAHISAAGGGRWKAYYHAPPTPLAPKLTGSIPFDTGTQTERPPTTTTAASAYDFGLHERTTRVDAVVPQDPEDRADTTVPDPVMPLPPEGTGANPSPTTVEVLVGPPATLGTPVREVGAAARPVPENGDVTADRAPAATKIILAFVSAGAVIVAVTTLGAIHLRGGSGPPERPVAPSALNHPMSTTAVHTPAGTAPDAPARASAAAPVQPPTPVPEHPPAAAVTPVRATTPHRFRHVPHHKPQPDNASPVQYGPDWMPILN